MDDIVSAAPKWLLRPLSAFAVIDPEAIAVVHQHAQQLPESIATLDDLLVATNGQQYDSLANESNALVWRNIDELFQRDDLAIEFCRYCENHLPHAALSRLIRRMIVHPSYKNFGKRLLKETAFREVAITRRKWGRGDSRDWSTGRRGMRYVGSRRRREEQGVPEITSVGELRKLLEIRSPKQLGFLLSAMADDGGTYRAFEIAKRGGGNRRIVAPCSTLLWVQRRIHRRILAKVSCHDAAHGFIQGRSTVSNALPHVGAELILKFDLRDFFPTIAEHRIGGLFASMGYHLGKNRYSTDDQSRDIAPVLARLCSHTTQRRKPGVLPQGAPTSPAISNLICRRLDSRLTGLATKYAGAYTRYADDLTFSFRDSIAVGRFRWWVDQICFQEGFTVRQDKFRAIRGSQRQQVTGIVVNEKLNVPRVERRKFRAILHQCRRDGVAAVAHRQPGIEGYMRGFAAYVNMVDAADNGALLREVADVIKEQRQ